MKKFYFVRHGESESNAGGKRGGAETPLTEKGYQQAAAIAERAVKLPIEIIIASTMLRARETARLIGERTGKEIITTDLTVERRMPSEFMGLLKDDPEAVRMSKHMWDHFQQPGFRFSDEENFDDMKERALQAFEFLVSRPENEVMVVTHWFFTWAALGVAIFGKDLTAYEFQSLAQTFDPLRNTSITIFSHDEGRQHPWHLEIWNDHAHLAD